MSTQETTMHRRRREWMAVGSLAVPPLAVLVTWLLWRGGLSGEVAVHWGGSGRADGWLPIEPLFWGALVVSAACFVLGIAAALMPGGDATDTRKAMTILGVVGAFVAAAWIAPAGSTYVADSPRLADAGGWMLLFPAALAYGAAVPRYLAPGRRRP